MATPPAKLALIRAIKSFGQINKIFVAFTLPIHAWSGFYSKAERQQAIAQLAKKMFHPLDPCGAYLKDEPCHKQPDSLTLSTARALVAGE